MNHPLDNLEIFLKENPCENFILDSNVIRERSEEQGILEYLYDKRKIYEIEPERISSSIATHNRITDIYMLPNVLSIKEIGDEAQTLHSRMLNHYRWYTQNSSKFSRNTAPLLEELNNTIFHMVKGIRSREVNPKGDFYNSIFESVNLLSKKLDSISDTKPRFLKDRINPKKVEYMGTDEKIIASSIYLTHEEDKSTSIVTNDSGILKKFTLCCSLLWHPELYYGLSKLNEKSIKVYRINKENFVRPIRNSRWVIKNDKFMFLRLGEEENRELKYQLDEVLYHGQRENDKHDRD